MGVWYKAALLRGVLQVLGKRRPPPVAGAYPAQFLPPFHPRRRHQRSGAMED